MTSFLDWLNPFNFNPIPLTSEQLGGPPSTSSPLTDLYYNALLGELSPAQSAELQSEESSNLQQASGGTMSSQDANTQAQNDVTNALKQAGAYPSSAESPTVVLLILGAVMALIFFIGAKTEL